MNRRRFPAAAVLLAICAAASGVGCGDPLTSASSYEAPLLSFEPYVPDLFQVESLQGLSIGVVWVDPLQVRDDLPQPAEGLRVRRKDGGVDGGVDDARAFGVDLFTPPPAGAVHRIADPTTGAVAVGFAFGEIVVYADRDGDGRFALAPRSEGLSMLPPDEYAGSNPVLVVIYVETPARRDGPVDSAWSTMFEPPGYRLAIIDCDPSLPMPTVKTVTGDHRFGVLLAAEASPNRIVTRTCLTSVPITVMRP
jgi:hypothetical protein